MTLDAADKVLEAMAEKAGYTVCDPIALAEVQLTIAGQADEIVRGRMKLYGDPEESWERIASQVTQHRGVTVTGEDVLWVLFHMKLERDKHSPQNRDHLRDACGYLSLIDILRQRKADRAKPQEVWVPEVVKAQGDDPRLKEAFTATFSKPPKLWDRIHYGEGFKTTGEVTETHYEVEQAVRGFRVTCAGTSTYLYLDEEGQTWRRA